jgi:hypothetical protein
LSEEKAARVEAEGIDPAEVTRLLSIALAGQMVTQVPTRLKQIGVRVWTPEASRKTDLDLGAFPIGAPDGHVFQLKRVATMEAVRRQPQIIPPANFSRVNEMASMLILPECSPKTALTHAPHLVGLDRTSRSSHYAHAKEIKGRGTPRRMMFRESTSLSGKLFTGATVPAVVFNQCGDISTR